MDEIKKAVCKSKILLAMRLAEEVLREIQDSTDISNEARMELNNSVITTMRALTRAINAESPSD